MSERTDAPTSGPTVSGVDRTPEGRRWLAELPSLIDELTARWELRPGRPFRGGSAAWTAPVTTAAGAPAVLKISWPHREAREEATALRWWDGRGACRLLAEDREHYALLLERCTPGTPMAASTEPPEELLDSAAAVLRRLWSIAPPAGPESGYETVAAVAAEWADTAAERMQRLRPPYDPGLVRHGVELLRSLPATAGRSVVVHGDFNPGNLLAADRAPWLAIDPKPMLGDPGYDPGPLLLQLDAPWQQPRPDRVLRRRFERFAATVGEPVERLLAWAVAREVEGALWYASRDEVSDGAAAMAQAAVLASLV